MRHPLRSLAVLLAAVGGWVAAGLILPARQAEAGWVRLFNGKDLDGWETWLNRPPGTTEGDRLGLNNDPLGVFKVENGAIRISGQVFGALTTRDEYENYHLRLEFRWGERKWPPRENAVRDSGILYHCVGEHGAASGNWMRSQECQIQEHDCGDYHSVAGGTVDVEADESPDGKQLRFRSGAVKHTGVRRRIIKSADHEKPTGEWNRIEVIADSGTCTHLVNGVVVLVMTDSRHVVDGGEVPLTRGKIQIQSEGAEVWYRNIELKRLGS